MASTLNAGVDGIILTASSTAALNIQVGGTNAIQIGTGATSTITNTTITSLTISNPAVFPAGSASAPAVTTTGDTNTGMYFPTADQVAITTGGTVAAGFNSNGLFFRNRIINGDMRIDQRNAGASVSIGPLSGTPTYITDRWKVYQYVDGVFAWQQVSDAPPGFVNSLKCTVTTASPTNNNEANLDQPIEGLNVADLAWGTANARPVTLSFWIKSSLTGQMGGSLTNSAVNRSYPWAVTVSSANTWEYKTITIPGDTSGTWLTTNGVGIRLYFDLGVYAGGIGPAGAWASANYKGATGDVRVMSTLNATWQITGVQLETGSVATPFERRPFGTELQLCQRYYEKSYDYATAAGSAVAEGYSAMNNSDQGSAVYIFNVDVFKVTKRVAANMRFWDLAGNLSRITDFTLGGLGRTDNRNSVYSYTGNVQNARMINVQSASTAGTYQWDASAEL